MIKDAKIAESFVISIVLLISCILIGRAVAKTDDLDSAHEKSQKNVKSGEISPVGFLMLTFGENELNWLDTTSANAELANIFLWKMKDTEKEIVDFNDASKWFEHLNKSDRIAYPILDTAIHHSLEVWKQEKRNATQENLVGSDGKIYDYASLYSPIFRKSVINYVDQLIDWVKENDKSFRIPAYINGAEWFLPYHQQDYNPLTIKAFRDWLLEKYGTLDEINIAWGSDFSKLEEIEPLRAAKIGDLETGFWTYSFSGGLDFGWSSSRIPIDNITEDIVATVKVKSADILDGVSALQIHGYGMDGNEVIFSGERYREYTESDWVNLCAILSPAADIKTISIDMVFKCPGKAYFKNPTIKLRQTGKQLLSTIGLSREEILKSWNFTNNDKLEAYGEVDPCSIFSIDVKKPKLDLTNPGVSWEDWTCFTFESMAKWHNFCTNHIMNRDKDRSVLSYIGFVWGSHIQWDYSNSTQRLDISLANTPDLPINGLQVAIAQDDYSYSTFPIDMARKYNKPIYAMDIVDFPYGLYSGFDAIYKGCMASVQHGAKGLLPCLWTYPGVPEYEYSNRMSTYERERLLKDSNEILNITKELKTVSSVLMISPVQSYSIADDGGYKSDSIDSGGLYHLILDMGYMPDAITPYEIAKKDWLDPSRYKIAFLSDCPVLEQSTNTKLMNYVKDGGTLFVSGRFPTKDFAGNELKTTILPKELLFGSLAMNFRYSNMCSAPIL